MLSINHSLGWRSRRYIEGDEVVVYLCRREIMRWTLAIQAIRRYGHWNSTTTSLFGIIELPGKAPLISEAAGLQSTSLQTDMSVVEAWWVIYVTFYTCMVVYGLPHVLGWNAHFATDVERTLWRAASLTLPFITVPFLMLVLISALFIRIQSFRFISIGRIFNSTLKAVHRFMASRIVYIGIGGIYVAFSGYLLAESVRQLFILPQDVFKQPSVSYFWPHFS